MNSRQPVPRNTERTLWGESSGYCMNPDCFVRLISDDKVTNLGEIAHIEPHSQGGDVSAENLILLCRNCHKENEPIDRPAVKDTLRRWKADRQKALNETFASRFETFDALSKKAAPLLRHNYDIFNHYGPHTGNPEDFKIWQAYEPQLIINNEKLKLLFENNLNLFADKKEYNNQKAIRYFIRHVDEFSETRNGFDGVRNALFPWRVLSIFGIQEEPYSNEQSINTIQNLIARYFSKGFSVDVDLRGERPCLINKRNGQSEVLFLDDNPRVEQLAFSEDAHEPHRTDMRLDNLLYTLSAIEHTGAIPSFESITDLTIITISGRVRVKLFYSYMLSISDLQSADLTGLSHVANLHNWNGGRSTQDARDYAVALGVRVMTFNEFIQFCRKNAI